MPAAFDKCVKEGGRVETKTIDRDRHQKFCYKDGKVYPGYVEKKNKIKNNSRDYNLED